MYDVSEKPHALVCTEIWGGNRKVIRTIRLPSLVAWVALLLLSRKGRRGRRPSLYVRLRSRPDLPRGPSRRGSGHGHDVDAVAQTLRSLMREYINSWNQSGFYARA